MSQTAEPTYDVWEIPGRGKLAVRGEAEIIPGVVPLPEGYAGPLRELVYEEDPQVIGRLIDPTAGATIRFDA